MLHTPGRSARGLSATTTMLCSAAESSAFHEWFSRAPKIPLWVSASTMSRSKHSIQARTRYQHQDQAGSTILREHVEGQKGDKCPDREAAHVFDLTPSVWVGSEPSSAGRGLVSSMRTVLIIWDRHRYASAN